MQTFKLSTNLRERAAYISHVPHGGLVDVDGGDGDLKAGTQPEQEPAHVELPRLACRHHHLLDSLRVKLLWGRRLHHASNAALLLELYATAHQDVGLCDFAILVQIRERRSAFGEHLAT